ncbi:MAG: MFS transporter, partial [Pararhizobium sp.]
MQVIVVLAATLGLDSADKATISAIAGDLKNGLSLSNADIGLLLAIVSFVGAVVTLPAGVLADRLPRRRLLIAAVATWAMAMAASGFADSFDVLLAARVFLGAVTAAAWPCIASLSGDLFAARERASIYGLILTGELAGTAIGFFVSTEVSAFAGWHWSFFVMAIPSAVLVWALWKYLPEPERGAQGWLTADEDDPHAQGSQDDKPNPVEIADAAPDIEPAEPLVEESDPKRLSWLGAMRFCLHVRTYRRLVIISALAYFFFSGVRGFGMIYFQEHYGLQHSAIILATAIIGAAALG